MVASLVNSPRAALLALTVGALAWSCAGSGGFAGGIGAAPKSKAAPEPEEDDDEDETANIPQEVSGAFLTCAFMDARPEVEKAVKERPNGTTEMACGIFKADKDGHVVLVSIDQLSLRMRILTATHEFMDLRFKRQKAGAPLNAVASVPTKHLAGTIQIDVKTATSRPAALRKSIPSVKTFDAEHGFDIAADMAAQGLQMTSDGRLGQSAASTASAGAGAGSDANGFFRFFFEYIAQAVGPEYAHVASNDSGTEVLCSCSQVASPQQGPGSAEPEWQDNFDNYQPVPEKQQPQRPPQEREAPEESTATATSAGTATGTATGTTGSDGDGGKTATAAATMTATATATAAATATATSAATATQTGTAAGGSGP